MEFNIDEAPNIPVILGIDDIPKIVIYETRPSCRSFSLQKNLEENMTEMIKGELEYKETAKGSYHYWS